MKSKNRKRFLFLKHPLNGIIRLFQRIFQMMITKILFFTRFSAQRRSLKTEKKDRKKNVAQIENVFQFLKQLLNGIIRHFQGIFKTAIAKMLFGTRLLS